LLFLPFAVPSTRLELNWSELATVAIGFSIDSHAFDRVGRDHFRAMRTAAIDRAIPGEIGLVSLSVPARDDRQSGMFQNPHLQAERAVDLLIDQIMRNQFGLADAPMHCLIEGTWVPGKTLRPQ